MKYATDYVEEKEMDKKVNEILTAIVDLLEDSKELPLTNKVMVEKEQILDLVDEVRSQLPHEIRQAKAIVSDRAKILEDAHNEAENLVTTAEERRRTLIDEHEITKAAKQEGERIVSEARGKSREIRNAADTYVSDLLANAEKALEENLDKFKSTREKLTAVLSKMTED